MPSADRGAAASSFFTPHHTAPADLLERLVAAYMDCRRHKRNTASALAFEADRERQLVRLAAELASCHYRPGPSICFVVTRPKPREVWAADFRDRIVHHLLYNHIAPRFHARFTADTCACIPGRGTLYAARRLEHQVRSLTQNWRRPAFYLKCDLANFFVAIDKQVLRTQLARRVAHEPWWMALADTVLMHDPREQVQLRGRTELLRLVPPHKSQFFANVYLDALDQHIKHELRAPHYVRYVDDFVLLHPSTAWLNATLTHISQWLPDTLGAELNPRKTVLQPVDRGIDFAGHVIKPWRRTTRPRILASALRRIEHMALEQLTTTANSYFGLLRQASHSHGDRAALTNALRKRGKTINADLSKTY